MKKITFLLAFLIMGTAMAQDFSMVVKNYLNNNRAQLSFQPEDIADPRISTHSFSKSMGLENVYVTQYHQGLEIFNSNSSFAIKNGTVLNANLSFVTGISSKVNTTNPSLSASAAVQKAASHLNLGSAVNLQVLETISPTEVIFSNGGISLENIPVKLGFQSTQDGRLKLAWDLSIYLLDASHYYSIKIDAVTGEMITVNDWVTSCDFGTPDHGHFSTEDKNKIESMLFKLRSNDFSFAGNDPQYRVFALPLESPNHGPATMVANPADPIASPFGWHDTNGAAGAEFTITRGNNVYAQEDRDANNGTGASPDGGANLIFDFEYNFNTNPVNMLDAATTNLFYWNNIMHDVWYQYGFDEASGNFQENNYGNGGAGSDSVNADAQDGGGTNNANFSTPPEGFNPRMQMFLWSPSGPPGTPLEINNGPLAGEYTAVPATFGNPLPEVPITADLVLVQDNDAGASIDPTDACDPILNGAALVGKIAVLRRGECEFGFKVLAVENAGAIAAIVVNNVGGEPIAMGPGDVGGSVTIPSVMVNQADGEAIIAALENGQTVNGSLSESGPYAIDGDLDNGIIAHEYGHGISIRLTGGANNSNCLSNDEQMGEGWSDWFGLMLTMMPGDQPEDIRGIGTYAIGQSTTGGGIRNAPYSTDFNINDFTYGDTNSGSISRPHGIGFVWATMLWDLNWAMIEEYGFDEDVYYGTGGNNIAMQLVIDGIKLQNCNPGFVDGRDAILMADELNNNGANRCLIWKVFADRGLGVSASQGSSFSRSDQVEAFDLPQECEFLGTGDNGSAEGNLVIYPNPTNGIINIATRTALGDATVAVYDLNGREVLTTTVLLNDTVSVNAQSISQGVYLVKIEAENYTHTAKLIIN
jgi:hypothetical protein